MPVRLLVGPAGSGKTGRALKIFKQSSPCEHQQSVRFVVPTVAHVLGIRRLLLSDPEFPGLLGDPICTFYRLAEDILAEAGPGRPRPVSDAQRLLVLRETIANAPPGYFDGVRDCPSFPQALGAAIGSLVSAAVEPDDLRQAVESAGDRLPESSARKIRGLAALYESYRRSASGRGAVDREDVLWRALEVAGQRPTAVRDLKRVILDGFHRLTPAQRELVRLLAENADETVIAVEFEEGRPEVFSSVEPMVEFLMGLPDVQVERAARSDDRAGGALGHLERHLFAVDPPKIEPGEDVTVLSGGTPAMEIELVAEEITKLVREGGFRFEEIGIVARDTRRYRHRIASTFRRFRIPLAAQGHPLAGTALARAVLFCLRVGLEGWRREHVLPLLRSSYLECDPEECVGIEAAAAASGTQSRRETWCEAWRPDDETADVRTRALAPIAAFEEKFGATGAGELCRAVEDLVSAFRRPESDGRLQEDCAAWKAIRRIMADIVGSEEFTGRKLTPAAFAELLERGLNTGVYRAPEAGPEGVSVLDVNALRGQKFRAVLLIGLLEGVLPRRVQEDLFLRDSEREALNPHLPHQFDLRMHEEGRERCLFYTAVVSARERLYLCHPLADDSGRGQPPSSYLDEVNELFLQQIPRVVRGPRDVVPPIHRAGTEEALVAGTVLDCCTSQDERVQEAAAATYNLLLGAELIGPGAFVRLGEEEEPSADERIPAHIRELLLNEPPSADE